MDFIRRLFSQPIVETKPQPHRERVNKTDSGPSNRLPPGMHVGKLSDVGQERERNEDTFLAIEALFHHDIGAEPFGLFIVADGMGGHQKGEVASALATRTAANHILQNVYLPYLTGNNDPSVNRPINEVLITAVEHANTVVQESVPEGGTTLTIALVMGNNAYIAHVGDSRAYLLKGDQLKQITKDHSLAQRLEELGQATASEAVHVQNVLYRAVGQNSSVEVDTYIQYLPPGSSLLLCSDGLWGMVGADALKEIMCNSPSPQEACQQLVATANHNGGLDNITSIIVTMGDEAKN